MQRRIWEIFHLATGAKQRANKEPIQGPTMGVCGHLRGTSVSRSAPGGQRVSGLLVKVRASKPGSASQMGKSLLDLCVKLPAKRDSIFVGNVIRV